MSIWLTKDTRVLVQGMTGKQGSFHAGLMKEYGTAVVAGVSPGKGGSEHDGTPVFDTVRQAVEATGADASMVMVPPAVAADAILEAAEAGVELIVAITEGIPVLDMARVSAALKGTSSRLIGPNCPGIITPGQAKIGIMPVAVHQPGEVGIISRSGTLTYEAVDQVTRLGLGQSTSIGIGGDPIHGTGFIDCLEAFEADPGTRAVVMIGEIGGSAEEQAAEYIQSRMSKPVVAFIAGTTAPPGKRMGHAGAIISGGRGTAADKIAALERCGVAVAPTTADIGATLKETL